MLNIYTIIPSLRHGHQNGVMEWLCICAHLGLVFRSMMLLRTNPRWTKCPTCTKRAAKIWRDDIYISVACNNLYLFLLLNLDLIPQSNDFFLLFNVKEFKDDFFRCNIYNQIWFLEESYFTLKMCLKMTDVFSGSSIGTTFFKTNIAHDESMRWNLNGYSDFSFIALKLKFRISNDV